MSIRSGDEIVAPEASPCRDGSVVNSVKVIST